MSELPAEEELPVLPTRVFLLSENCAWPGWTTGCTLGVSGVLPGDGSTISMPWRRVIISRKKQATAEAAEPFSFEKSKRLTVASPAAWAACAMGSEVLAAKASWKISSQLPHLPRRGFQPS